MLLRYGLFLLLSCHLAHAAFQGSSTVVVSTEPDSDEDGLDDEMEALLGTNPEAADTDGDGWDDLAEVVLGTDPCDPFDFPHQQVAGEPDALPNNPALRLKVLELLTARLNRGGTTQQGSGKPSYQFGLRYYYPASAPRSLAVEVSRSDLKAGTFLLLWRQQVSWNPLGIEQRYTVAVRTDDGRIIGEWKTPAPVEETWRYVGLPFALMPRDEGRLLTLSVTPEDVGQLDYSLTDFVAVPAGVEADVDRDGVIGPGERPTSDKPLRHWINDDDDSGECQERADLPGRPAGQADFSQPGIDGLRDLVDFIPINLNLAQVTNLLRPSAGFRYFVSHPERAVQLALTGLTPTKAGAIHRDPDLKVFGPGLDGAVPTAEVLRPDSDGRIELPATFVERIVNKGHGVILLEGARESRLPLRIEIRQGGRGVAELELPLAIGPVEAMYRHVNVCRYSYDYSGRPAPIKKPGRGQQTGEPPGLPDAESNGRWVVLVHGYNVPGDGARGWHAETFKRLHALGSRARFVGVTWNGDTGLDYHKAVYHAFQAGDELPRALGFLDPSRTVLIAHSLGNIVASQAVQAGFSPARYFLLNAALPLESLTGEASLGQAAEMTEQSWRPYARRLFASDWAKLFPSADLRRSITWENCFWKVRKLNVAINCYSPGEDVTNCPTETTSASVLAMIWSGRAIDYGVWKTQELLKGVGWSRSLAAIAMERTQGGWGFNPAWRGRYVPNGATKGGGGHYERLDPAAAARLTPAQLSQDPFFGPPYESCLRGARTLAPSPILDCANMRYDLLARAVPAMTYAAGGAPVPIMADGGRIENFNLETLGRTNPQRWPTEGHGATRLAGRWLHSDYKNAALPFVAPLFAHIIGTGSLR